VPSNSVNVVLPGRAVAATARPVRRRIMRWSPHRPGWGLVFVAPALLYLAAFQLYPVLFSVYVSFHDYDLVSPPRFVGLKNYVNLAHDQAFLNSVVVTVGYVFYTVVPVLGFSFALAWALSRLQSGRAFWRTLIFLPSILPLVSVALIWKLLLNYRGPVNTALGALGWHALPWLTNSTWAPWALILMSWWHATSYYMIIFLAGLLAIPRQHYEAAALDGAGGWRLLWHITLPLLRPTIVLVVVLATVNGLKTFAFQQIMTDGGPANATQILTLLIYKTAFNYLQMGRASTYSIVLFVGILLISLLQIWLFRSEHRA
jgi:ABC-type sugar transport system permease subunit